jgi:hypothetical protein
MTNYGPNDRDPRDEPNGGERLEGKIARETAQGREETGARGAGDSQGVRGDSAGGDRDRSRQGDGANDGDTSRGDDALGEPVASREAGFAQHARKGQAESPKQTNHFEPPKHKEGHH